MDDISAILLAESLAIPSPEYPGQPLTERVEMIPCESEEEHVDDLAKFLTARQVQELARDYFLTGNLAESARKHKVRYPIALRASKELLFDEELVTLEREHKVRQKARLDGLLDKALTQLEDRLEHGDEAVTKDGLVHVAVKARDLASIAAILTERREKLDEATKPVVGVARGKIETLADQLRAKAAASAIDATVVPLKQVSNGA